MIMKTVIKSIAELIQTENTPRKWVAGEDMKNINTIKDAFIEIFILISWFLCGVNCKGVLYFFVEPLSNPLWVNILLINQVGYS